MIRLSKLLKKGSAEDKLAYAPKYASCKKETHEKPIESCNQRMKQGAKIEGGKVR